MTRHDSHPRHTEETKAHLRRVAKRRDYGCRAPRCRNISKGPRFRYLCEKHRDVSLKRAVEFAAAYKRRKLLKAKG